MEYMYFNNAGAGIMSPATYKTVLDHMALEMKIGGYAAANVKSDEVNQFYSLAANLLNARSKDEIAFIDSASRGWNLVMYGLNISKADTIVTLASEYGTNLLTIYDIANKTCCGVKIVKCDDKGIFNLEDVEQALISGGTILAVSHVAAQGSIVNPVIELGALAKKYNVTYIVDGCQAVGQIRVDVQQINCCAYITAGRKWLRGPRGTGILYVRKDAPIHTPQIDLASADLVFDELGEVIDVKIREDAKQFELWEKSTASLLGLRNAIQEYLDFGIENAEKEIYEKANYIRKSIVNNPNLSLVGSEVSSSGVVGFYVKNPQSENLVKERLEKHNFIISYICDWDCPIFFPKNGIHYVFRISPHYYTSKEEIQAICQLIQEL
ncbi:MAG: aminotransferase class V-fold PLP-dependent enzyme [Acutalibacter sp.]|nr:aminotransferase class V-fold PLP-dependent enzyme [Acutalibacter sp.]